VHDANHAIPEKVKARKDAERESGLHGARLHSGSQTSSHFGFFHFFGERRVSLFVSCKNACPSDVSSGTMIMSTEPADSSHSIPPTRTSLPRRLGNPNDAEIWTEFYQLYKKLVFGFASRSGLSRADAEEVTQDVFNEVSTNVHAFLARPQRGSFRGWLLNLTRWRVMDKLRQRQRHEKHRAPPRRDGEDDRTDTIERVPDTSAAPPDDVWEDEWERQILDTALENLRGRVDTRHFQAFELHVGQGVPVRRIARQLEMNPATVYVIHFRLKKQLKAEVARLKARVN
jgi:RNA polymerase sigma factor (sigma-70 family)